MATRDEYRVVWNELKATGRAEITVSTVAAKKVVMRILQTKAKENVARRLAGKIYWSKLVIDREQISATMIKITFSFLYQNKI